ncbi:MAG TPA: N-acetyl-gamma-glutamyl-phosphate reductase [Clostridiales bacterium]|nr:N-acetyl-gamma-glutamyl-phosphate reductase [Clostridiales bacterium]
MKNIFIDGSAGTTGLRIFERLSLRDDIKLITLSDELRKDEKARKEALNASDIAFLCLPDIAAKEAVSMLENPDTVIIDTSTAHRTNPDWTYGFAELGLYEDIRNSKRIANPGCHASGFIALIKPLIDAKILDKNALLSVVSLTGYSGGGKTMIAEYEDENRSNIFDSPRLYALNQTHKHIPEMTALTGIKHAPVFMPIVDDFYSGMQVIIPLFAENINGKLADIIDVYKSNYNSKVVYYTDIDGLSNTSLHQGLDSMSISVCGNDERFTLIARYDNLGKGASGAAIQNMNIVMGVDETLGLEI